jgi:hypothetical protein
MTWQRIDGDIYIDDALVNCAEYQLFIDEMRRQEKYHQPDHWASYQFPPGQANEPILGIRHSDAVAFCEWLTRRKDEGWNFRLPDQKEADAFPVKFPEGTLLGYWVSSDYQFIWVEANSLSRNLTRTRNLARDLTVARTHNRTSASNPDLTLNRDLDRVRAHSRAQAIALALNRDLARDFELARVRARNLALIVDHALRRIRDINLELAHILVLTRDLALNLDRNLAIILARDLDLGSAHDLKLDHAFNLASDLALDLAHNLDLARDLIHALNLDVELDRSLEHALSIYIDIFTLQERIAGCSPAFEGIRLVKYRE